MIEQYAIFPLLELASVSKESGELETLPNILKTRDLAILLDMSPDAVNDMARKGILKGYKSGNQWRFRRKDVEKFLGREQAKTPS
jgi:excisionase family DNA binding protein